MLNSAKRSCPLLAALLASALLTGCLGFGGKKKEPDLKASAEPDKVLYERAMQDLKKNRYAIARLTLETLMNTYPDSEYLAKAKLAIADSYYKEGGTSGLTHATAEYKDFITFFPFLDEAAYAQMQVGMAHYRQMEKPDRDQNSARNAEAEFQTFLLKYPDHPLAQQAEQRLREVQEVRAEGEFRIARYYFIKGNMRAAGGRLLELTDRYPLYSQADKALWMLGQAFERAEKGDIAARYYTRIVQDYPLSGLVDDAKQKLTKLGVPVPQPSPEALARMQKERELAREGAGILRKSFGMFRTGPDVSMAARVGKPNLNPPAEAGGGETITPGGNISVSATATPGGASASATESAPAPANPKPGEAASNPPAANPDPQAASEKASAESLKTDDKGKKTEDKKAQKESSSKKKKGLRRLIPW